MSRAVLYWRRLGSPVALRNAVFFMPIRRAVRVISLAKFASVPPTASASTVAASFADFVTIARTASSTEIERPGFSPSRDGRLGPPRAGRTRTRRSRASLPDSIASKRGTGSSSSSTTPDSDVCRRVSNRGPCPYRPRRRWPCSGRRGFRSRRTPPPAATAAARTARGKTFRTRTAGVCPPARCGRNASARDTLAVMSLANK